MKKRKMERMSLAELFNWYNYVLEFPKDCYGNEYEIYNIKYLQLLEDIKSGLIIKKYEDSYWYYYVSAEKYKK